MQAKPPKSRAARATKERAVEVAMGQDRCGNEEREDQTKR